METDAALIVRVFRIDNREHFLLFQNWFSGALLVLFSSFCWWSFYRVSITACIYFPGSHSVSVAGLDLLIPGSVYAVTECI